MTKNKYKYFGDLNKKYKLKDTNFIKRVLKIGVPMGIASIITSLMIVIDKFFIGQAATLDGAIGAYAIGSTYVSSWFFSIVTGIIFSVTSMIGIVATQYFGAKMFKEVVQNIKLSFWVSISIAIIGVIIAQFFSLEITKVISNTKTDNPLIGEANLKYGPEYMKVISLSTLTYVFTTHITRYYAWNEKTKVILYVTVVALAANALFNYLFMFVFKLGVIGNAWSTILVETIMSIFLLWYLKTQKDWKGKFNIFHKPFSISKKVLRKIISHSSFFVNQIFFTALTLGGTILISKVYPIGPTILGMTSPFENLFLIAMTGVLSTSGNIVGKNLGSSKYEEAYSNSLRITIYAVIVAIVGAFILISLSPLIPIIFGGNDYDINITKQVVIVVVINSTTYVLWIWAQGYGVSLRTGGKGLIFACTSAGSALLDFIIVVILFIYSPAFEYWMVFGIWRSTRFLRVIASYYFYQKQTWIKNITIDKTL